jgi:RNA-directed DNA polymerase
MEALRESFYALKRKAAPGVDGVTWQEYATGLEDRLKDLHSRVHRGAYRAQPSRRVYIPKANGKQRPLGIAALEDKIVQQAVVTVLNAIYEEDFRGFSYGFRPGRGQHMALDALYVAIKRKRVNWILDLDLKSFFDNIPKDKLVQLIEKRIADPRILRLIQKWLNAGVMEDGVWSETEAGTPQGAVISPLLSNVYLTEVDRMLERAQEASRDGKYTYVEYARFADDLVILIDAYKRHDWLMAAVEKRLREELAELQVEINEEKSRIVDLSRGESFGFLGFDFRQVRSLRGAWRAHYTPKLKKRTALLRKLKDMFRRHQSQPVDRVVKLINPVLRGWVNYFAVGHSSECFSFVKDWVEKKIKRHMQRARNRQGFGWTRWSREWTYNTLGLFRGYRVVRPALKAVPAG